MSEERLPVTYDSHGRVQYHPDYHGKHKQAWSNQDEKFLIENYETMGPDAVALALERTIGTVMARVYNLRKTGKMAKPVGKRSYRRRSRYA